ncbi:MAG: MFS transporter [Rubrivivax sp.]|nr:MFS transporter [Rubrivivax sp.]
MNSAAGRAASLFFAFAFTYFLSALLRAVTATLAPVFSVELGLRASDLGLLAGAYFLGFAGMQLPLGQALDRFGPRRTLLVLVSGAVIGCMAFAQATQLSGLIAARVLIGAGVGACLMAPLTLYRRQFSPAAQLRANSWMLMTGSLGMVASTLPVQWLLPSVGWRGLFWIVAALLAVGMALVVWLVPADEQRGLHRTGGSQRGGEKGRDDGDGGYRSIVRHPLFVATAPLGFFLYGGMIAVQSLWAGPWLTRVALQSPAQAAQGLFGINLAMLMTFLIWGALMPRLAARGVDALRLMAWGLPLALLGTAANVALGAQAGAVWWALWCMACTFVSLSQPAVAAAFTPRQAGRALSAFNLVIFSGVFCVQWGIGLAVDALRAVGWGEAAAFRVAFGVLGACCAAAYGWFLGRFGALTRQASA